MIELTGINLGQRHRELNNKVKEAFVSNISFDDLKNEEESSDVDKLFKIELATKTKNVGYIIDILKLGDSLHISHALKKCVWLYDDYYSNIVNTNYLHHNIFPFMSVKMKKKMLTTISIHIRDENRAVDFCNYCIGADLKPMAKKFLVYTSDTFKLNIINTEQLLLDDRNLKYVIGNSYTLLDAYINKLPEWRRNDVVRQFRHFYFVSAVKYFELLEKYAVVVENAYNEKNVLGLRISKDIMTKHKERVFSNAKLYVNLLNQSKIRRHSKPEDAKLLIVNLMPQNVNEFWSVHFHKTYKYIIDLIPAEERYVFFKKVFTDCYPNQKFETCESFIKQNYYELMNAEELEKWALYQIANDTSGSGKKYYWYRYINFEKAFVEIKKIIQKTTDHSKRSDIIKVLINSAKNNRELETLFNYYYERHVNEGKGKKESLIDKVISCHNVFEFDEGCWTSFNKLLHSIDVYDTSGRAYCNQNYKILSLMYHILHDLELPDALVQYMESNISIYSMKEYLEELSIEKKQIVYDYVLNFYLKRITRLDFMPQDLLHLEKIKTEANLYIHYILEFMAMYQKTKSDIPEIVIKFVNLDPNSYKFQQILQNSTDKDITEIDFLKCLKTDATQATEYIPKIKSLTTGSHYFKLNRFLKLLKIYFSKDIAQQYLDHFHKLLLDKDVYYSTAYMAVYAIFQLSNEESKLKFMNKYAPRNPKKDHNIDSNLAKIQESICRFACYSRPPVPLKNITMYLKGDYVKYCLPMFNMYLVNLPAPLCIQFVESIIDAPVSVQKHGLRLAFKCFPVENLSKLVVSTWKKSKNVSLRSVIYKAFSNKTVVEDSRDLFDVLKTLTMDLNQDDDEDIYNILSSIRLSNNFHGEFLDIVWRTVNKFDRNTINLERRAQILRCIDNNIKLMRRDVLSKIIEENLELMFAKFESPLNEDIISLVEKMWELTANFVVYFTRNEEECQQSVEFTKNIVNMILKEWNEDAGGFYIYRRTLSTLISHMDNKSFDTENFENCIPIFTIILEELQAKLPFEAFYYLSWKLRVIIINRKVIEAGRQKYKVTNKADSIIEAARNYGQEICSLLKESVENKIYNSYFLPKVSNVISRGANNIFAYICLESEEAKITYHDILLETARGLLESEMVESQLLALALLPQEPECNLNEYKNIVDKIRKSSHMDVQLCVYEKYYGDFKRRRYV